MFGDYAFKRSLSARFEQGMAVAIKLITELNAIIGIIADQSHQVCSTLYDGLLPQVRAVEMQQIECV